VRVPLTLDDELIKQAREYTGITDITALIHAGLKALVEREASRRAALLGGTMPDFPQIPRRRFPMERKKKA